MAYSRGLGVIGIVGISWLVAVGCGDDGKNILQPEAGGEGGEAPNGGKTGVAGSKNVGGASAAGTGGDPVGPGGGPAGAGGEATGGSAGAPGGGSAGEPTIPPPGGAAGNAGAGGEGGGGGEPPITASRKQCSNECESDYDCAIGGAVEQMVCDLTTSRCVAPSAPPSCTAPSSCVPFANGWVTCTSSASCDEATACVDWQGKGYCAYLAEPECFIPGEVPQTLGEFGKVDSPVEVCVAPGACDGGMCELGCEANGCGDDSPLECGTTSHLCECSDGAQCPSGICGPDHLCAQCATSEDCPGGITGQDTCVNGKCGCSSATVCPDLTEAGTPVCE